MAPLPPSPLGRVARLLLCVLSSCYAVSAIAEPVYSDRIRALVEEMTLEEKAGQLSSVPGINRHGGIEQGIRSAQVGILYIGIGVTRNREYQRLAVEETRLGIPLIFTADVIHGSRTVYPVPLGEAASFEPELARRTARAAAVEATARGLHWTFAPMVDIGRDQRWGRVVEGAGEDPFLGSAFAAARVRGFQGDDLRAHDSLAATPKHFAAYGGAAAGRDYAQVDVSMQTLRDVYLPPFKAAFDAGALTVMSSFNDINGVPATANHWLLTELLRDEWGFEGVVVSDYTADIELIDHGYAADEEDAARRSIIGGLGVTLGSPLYNNHLPELVLSGQVPMERVDEAVLRMLHLKETVGLFDDPYRSLDPEREADTSYMAEHDALAREAARRSIVLLKNEGTLLPLRKSGQRIALIGPFARDVINIQGPWASDGDKSRYVTLEAGVLAALEDPSLLEVVPGSEIEGALVDGISAAIAAAQRADVVVLAVGESQGQSGEAHSRVEITLPAPQKDLVAAVAATGRPVVILLRNGRALALEGAVRDARSIVVTWFLGTQNGHAIADVLFGDYNPSAKLPVSFPVHSGQQPFFYNHPRTGRPAPDNEPSTFRSRWLEVSNVALYPFGHGLSYTTFEYGTPKLNTAALAWDEELEIRTKLTNTGKIFGEEVVQLYIHDRVASRVRPVRELKGFEKIGLQPGESKEVTFRLTRDALAFTNMQGDFIAEPGVFDLWVSGSSASGEPVQFELLAQD